MINRMRTDIYIHASREGDSVTSDNNAMREYLKVAREYHACEHGGNRLRIHLVLRNQLLANTLRRLPLEQELSENVELYAYTLEDFWAMEVLGLIADKKPLLDREAIGYSSMKRVHFVLFGVSDLAQSLIVNAALTAHYPNFCRDNSLRTRITWVGDSLDEFTNFKYHYCGLLENSFRRDIVVDNEDVKLTEFSPKYANSRCDFVDIEWEFVAAPGCSEVITYKMKKWAEDDNQLLTIAYCYNEDSRNLESSIALSDNIREKVPTLIKQDDATVINVLRDSNRFSNLIPVGANCGQVSMKNFIRMAQCVNYAYCRMRSATKEETQNGISDMIVATELPTKDELQRLWNNPKLTTPKRWSNVYNAFTVPTKMRSLGYSMQDWKQLIAIKDHDVELLAEVEHNRWCIEELILGYLPTTDEEHSKILSDIANREVLKREFKHDDLRHFSELGTDESGLSVKRYDVALVRSLPLIAHSYYLASTDEE